MKPVTRARLIRLAPVIVVWTVSFLPLFAARRSLVVAPEIMVWVALGTLLAMVATLGYVVRSQLPRPIRQDVGRWIAIAAAPIAVIAAAASPASLAPRFHATASTTPAGRMAAGDASPPAAAAITAIGAAAIAIHRPKSWRIGRGSCERTT